VFGGCRSNRGGGKTGGGLLPRAREGSFGEETSREKGEKSTIGVSARGCPSPERGGMQDQKLFLRTAPSERKSLGSSPGRKKLEVGESKKSSPETTHPEKRTQKKERNCPFCNDDAGGGGLLSRREEKTWKFFIKGVRKGGGRRFSGGEGAKKALLGIFPFWPPFIRGDRKRLSELFLEGYSRGEVRNRKKLF